MRYDFGEVGVWFDCGGAWESYAGECVWAAGIVDEVGIAVEVHVCVREGLAASGDDVACAVIAFAGDDEVI